VSLDSVTSATGRCDLRTQVPPIGQRHAGRRAFPAELMPSRRGSSAAGSTVMRFPPTVATVLLSAAFWAAGVPAPEAVENDG